MYASRLLMMSLVVWALSHAAAVAGEQSEPEARKTPADRIRQALNQNITTDFNGGSLSATIEHLREKGNLAISFDQFALNQHGINPEDGNILVPVKVQGEKLGSALRKTLANFRLTYIVLDDVVLITTEEMATARQLQQRVQVDLNHVPLKQAARSLARQHGINLVIDPRLGAKADAAVSLQLDNVALDTTIRLLAELADLKAVKLGNVIFVTTEDRAEKLRREDINDGQIAPPVLRAMPFNGAAVSGPAPFAPPPLPPIDPAVPDIAPPQP